MRSGLLLPLLLAGTLLGGPARADGDLIVFHAAYGAAGSIVVDGRMIERHAEHPPAASDGRLHNLRRTTRRFANDERKGRPLTLTLGQHSWPLQTDDEGYFHLDAETALPPGWHPLAAQSGKTVGEGRLLLAPPGNTRGLISDIDDTVVVSEVLSKRRLLANTFLKNPAQRQAVPGVAALYAQVAATNPQADAAPLFYLSASPRQLHAPIADFLARHDFPAGVLLTKRVSDDRKSDPWTDQFRFKTNRIEEIFARLPEVRFILVGDDGEKDPEIYDRIRRQHPGRVEAIWIRRVNPDPARPRFAGQDDLADILAAGYLPAAYPPGRTTGDSAEGPSSAAASGKRQAAY